MNVIRYLWGVAFLVGLSACGGGGGNPGASTGTASTSGELVSTTSTELPASVEVLTSSGTLQSASGEEVLITAFVKNGANVGMASQAVSFSASSGTLVAPSSQTDANGTATVKLIAGSNKANRDITVSVTAGSVTGSLTIPVNGTRLTITGEGTLQAGGSATQYSVRALDSSGSPIGSAQLSISSSLANPVSASTVQTDATGTATFLYTPNAAGNDSISVSGLGASVSTSVAVNALDFSVLTPASNVQIPIGTSQTVIVRYRYGGVGVSGANVSFTTTRGTFASSSATTDGSGDASASLSSTTAGPAVVAAQIPNVGSVNLPVEFVAVTPASIVAQANPGSVLPNASGSTTNQSTIDAVIRDANGNPVANRQVDFTLEQGTGTLSAGSALTDTAGRAQVQFISGSSSTSIDGVVIRATVASTQPAITQSVALTVNGQALFMTLGFGNTIGNLDETTYSKQFSIYVTDANGAAVGNQVVSLAVTPVTYGKGALTYNGTRWVYASGGPTVCANEDADLDGRLDAGEDINGDGQLTPGNIGMVAPGSVTTDSSGRATFALQYGEQFALWAKVRITARTSVAGTESRHSMLFDLEAAAADLSAEAGPAGVTSPFGSSTSCTNSN